MRRFALSLLSLAVLVPSANAQTPPGTPPVPPGAPVKENANPCRDEVSAALQKLRKSSWFRMDTTMITEKGPTTMQVDYVLPDRMHQRVKIVATGEASEIILVGNDAWSRHAESAWSAVSNDVTQQLKAQMQESVVEQQADVGNYACKGRTKFDGKDVLSYKLEDEPAKDSNAPRNEAFRMFYVDAVTGMPVSNALIVPGREDKPIFKTVYAFPLDITIEPPKIEANAAEPPQK